MPLRVVCCFSHLTGPDGWQDSHYCVNHFLHALKGHPLGGYAYVRLFPGELRRRLDADNAARAVDWFGEMAAAVLKQEFGPTACVLVHILGSACRSADTPTRTASLAQAAAGRLPGARVFDRLRFDQRMHSAHDGQGSRDAASLFRHLVVHGSPPTDAPYVLVDDVLTTGGHLAAAAARLRDVGAQVALAVCAVSASQVAQPDPFARAVRWIDDYVAGARVLGSYDVRLDAEGVGARVVAVQADALRDDPTSGEP
jgi:hypothetical protein